MLWYPPRWMAYSGKPQDDSRWASCRKFAMGPAQIMLQRLSARKGVQMERLFCLCPFNTVLGRYGPPRRQNRALCMLDGAYSHAQCLCAAMHTRACSNAHALVTHHRSLCFFPPSAFIHRCGPCPSSLDSDRFPSPLPFLLVPVALLPRGRRCLLYRLLAHGVLKEAHRSFAC